MADATEIGDHIEALVEEEQALWADSEHLGEEGHARLVQIRAELDRCWTLLRRCRATSPESADHHDVEPARAMHALDPLELNVGGGGGARDEGEWPAWLQALD